MTNQMTQIHQQTIALGGVFQAATWVEQLARQGQIDPTELTTAVSAILNMNPISTISVFGSLINLKSGLLNMRQLLGSERQKVKPDIIRYTMSLLHLEKRLQKKPAMLNQLGKELAESQAKLDYFNDGSHDAVIGSLARNYLNTLSQLKFRIQVTGNPSYLNQQRNADQIRVILLFGVRSALLWRQLGGQRLHLLFRRKALHQAADDLIHGRIQDDSSSSSH